MQGRAAARIPEPGAPAATRRVAADTATLEDRKAAQARVAARIPGPLAPGAARLVEADTATLKDRKAHKTGGRNDD
ncbi:hypothetical protein X963_5666 [Burkholderia pseudomallei MSHR7498]|nr:hypothetical protein X963_5666 [Burkholderia pseudomallei MSHR7498]